VEEFHRILLDSGVPASVRKPRGQDVLAACGQLHLKDRASTVTVPAVAP